MTDDGTRVPATLGYFRVFRSDDTYPVDPPIPQISRSAKFGRWSVSASFGQIDEVVRKLLGMSQCGPPRVLDYMFGRAMAGGSSAAETLSTRDQAIDDELGRFKLPAEWCEAERLYSSIVVTCQVQLPSDAVIGGPKHFWIPDALSAHLIHENEDGAEGAIGCVVARLMTSTVLRTMGDVNPHSSRFFVDCGERARTLLGSFSGSGHATVTRGSWEDTRRLMQDTPLELPIGTASKVRSAIGKIGQFYAMAYSETDPFKRFLWSYNGLETIANAVGDHGRTRIIGLLADKTDLGDVIFQDLLWPEDVRETDPNRHVRFKFAVVAALLGEGESDLDARQFIVINRARNTIHGRLLPSLRIPMQEAFNLFDKYADRAVRFLAGP